MGPLDIIKSRLPFLNRGKDPGAARRKLEEKEFKEREKAYKDQRLAERDKRIESGIKKGGHMLITIAGIVLIFLIIMLSGFFTSLASVLNIVTSSIGPVLNGLFSIFGLSVLPGSVSYSFIQLEITILSIYFTALFFIAIYHLLIWKRPQKSTKIITQILFWATIVNVLISFIFANPIGAWQSGEESFSALMGGVTQPFKVGSCSFQSALGGVVSEECNQLLQKNENEVVQTQRINVRGNEYPSTTFDYRGSDDVIFFTFDFETTNVELRVVKHECYANSVDENIEGFFDGASRIFSEQELFENKLIYEEDHDITITRKKTETFECGLDQLMQDNDAVISQLEVKVFFEADNQFSQTIPTVMCEHPEIESHVRANRYNSCQDITWDELGKFTDASQLQSKALGGNAVRLDTQTLWTQFPLHLGGDSSDARDIRGYFVFRDSDDLGFSTSLALHELDITDISLPSTLEQLSTQEYSRFIGTKTVEQIGERKQASQQLTLTENENAYDPSLPVALQDIRIETTSTIEASLVTNSIFFRTPGYVPPSASDNETQP